MAGRPFQVKAALLPGALEADNMSIEMVWNSVASSELGLWTQLAAEDRECIRTRFNRASKNAHPASIRVMQTLGRKVNMVAPSLAFSVGIPIIQGWVLERHFDLSQKIARKQAQLASMVAEQQSLAALRGALGDTAVAAEEDTDMEEEGDDEDGVSAAAAGCGGAATTG